MVLPRVTLSTGAWGPTALLCIVVGLVLAVSAGQALLALPAAAATLAPESAALRVLPLIWGPILVPLPLLSA